MQQDKPYLDNLTALRGIAAFLVVLFHGNELIAPFIKTETTYLVRKLYLMVDLFFILSGFIMCYVYESFFNNPAEKGKLKKFLKARFARVYPLHFITLTVCVFVVFVTFVRGKYGYFDPVVQAIYNFRSIPANLFLLQSAHVENIFTWNVPSWSISAEWIAYLVFPFLVKPFSRFSNTKAWFSVALVFVLYACLIFYIAPNRSMPFPFFKTGADLDLTFDWGFARGLLGFVLGMCVYRLFVLNTGKAFLGNGWFISSITVIYCIYSHFNFTDFGAPLFFSLMILSIGYGSKSINAFFNLGILQKLGDWSFSIYMWHAALYVVVTNIQTWQMTKDPDQSFAGPVDYFGLTNTWVVLIIYFIVTLVVGALSFRFIENPGRRWINSWGKK